MGFCTKEQHRLFLDRRPLMDHTLWMPESSSLSNGRGRSLKSRSDVFRLASTDTLRQAEPQWIWSPSVAGTNILKCAILC